MHTEGAEVAALLIIIHMSCLGWDIIMLCPSGALLLWFYGNPFSFVSPAYLGSLCSACGQPLRIIPCSTFHPLSTP